MRKWWILFWGCVSLIYNNCSASERDSLQNAIKNRSLLWRITGNDMKRPSYIFGTMHMICKDDYVWTPAMKKSLKASKEVCFEMDMDDPSLMTEVATGMIDYSGKTLQDYFSEEDYKILERYFADSLEVNIAMFTQLKPTALVTFLAQEGLACNNMVSYEIRIMEEAKKLKLEVTGLEHPQEQIALLESLPTDTIIHEVLRMIKGKQNNADEYERLVKAYKMQDIATLYSLMTETDQNKISLNAFLDERNIKWIERMEERMDQQPVFFAIGAGHLWGTNGVINLLREKGYKIQAVK